MLILLAGLYPQSVNADALQVDNCCCSGAVSVSLTCSIRGLGVLALNCFGMSNIQIERKRYGQPEFCWTAVEYQEGTAEVRRTWRVEISSSCVLIHSPGRSR